MTKDYGYDSGERQTSLAYSDIRRDHQARYELAAKLVNRFGFGGPEALGLDIFCGNGYGTALLATRTFTPMLGMDGSREAIDVANRYFSTPETVFSAKLFPFTLPRARFDFAVSFEAIEHVRDDALLIGEIAAALVPGGLFVASVPNQGCLPLTDAHSRFHVRHYHVDEFEAALGQAGLTVEDVYRQDAYLMDGGRVAGVLPANAMELTKGRDGQFVVYVCRKTSGD